MRARFSSAYSRAAGWALGGNLAQAGSQWAIVILIAHLATPQAVGHLALGLAVAAPVFMFTNMRLRLVLATSGLANRNVEAVMRLRLASSCIGLALISTLAAIDVFPEPAVRTVLMVALAKAVETLSDLVYGAYQGAHQLTRLGRSQLIRSVLVVAFAASAVEIAPSAVAAATGFALAGAIAFLVLDWPSWRRLGRLSYADPARVHARGALGALVRSVLPLGLVATLASLSTNVPRYLVQRYVGSDMLGVYAAVGFIAAGGALLAASVAAPVLRGLGEAFERGDAPLIRAIYRRLLGVALGLGAGGVLLALGWGGEALHILYGPDYAAHGSLLVLLLAAGTMQYVVLYQSYVLTALRRYKVQIVLHSAALSTTTLICLWLLPRLGARGAALGEIAGGMFFVIVAGRLLHTRLRALAISP